MDNDVRQKINDVHRYIGDLARKLAGENKPLEDKLKTVLKELILNNRVENSVDEIASLLEIPFKENLETNTESTIDAKTASEELRHWVEKNKEAVMAYRGDSIKTNTGEGIKKDKIEEIKEQIKAQSLADKVNRVYDENETEYQTETVLKETYSEPIGEIYDNSSVTQRIEVSSVQTPTQHEAVNPNIEKITTGINDEPLGLVTNGVNFLKKSASDMVSKLGIGTKKILGEGLGKVGGSIVKGLNSTVSTSNKLTGVLKTKTIGPALVVFFVVFVLINIALISKASPLVPKIESNEGNNENSESGTIGNRIITKTEDGRIKDCGVGMETDFYQSKRKTMVKPDFLIGGKYDKELEDAVGDSAGTRCGVVYAAQYLAYDFEFHVPYYWGASYKKLGLNPTWGEYIGPNEKNKKRFYNGLDCGHFRDWAWVNGGFPGGRPGNTTVIPFGDCEKIKLNIEPGDGLYVDGVDGKDSHSGIVLAYNDTHIKFAHAGGSYGVTTGLVNICTGIQEIDGSGNNFKVLQKKIYNNSDL